MKVYVAIKAHQIVGIHPTMRKARDAHFSQEALTNVAVAYYEAKGKGWKNYEGNEIQVFELELEGAAPEATIDELIRAATPKHFTMERAEYFDLVMRYKVLHPEVEAKDLPTALRKVADDLLGTPFLRSSEVNDKISYAIYHTLGSLAEELER